jgi:hypothetical protein
MAPLSAASMESYHRAYPMLVKLHIIQELESGFQLLRGDLNILYVAMSLFINISTFRGRYCQKERYGQMLWLAKSIVHT